MGTPLTPFTRTPYILNLDVPILAEKTSRKLEDFFSRCWKKFVNLSLYTLEDVYWNDDYSEKLLGRKAHLRVGFKKIGTLRKKEFTIMLKVIVKPIKVQKCFE